MHTHKRRPKVHEVKLPKPTPCSAGKITSTAESVVNRQPLRLGAASSRSRPAASATSASTLAAPARGSASVSPGSPGSPGPPELLHLDCSRVISAFRDARRSRKLLEDVPWLLLALALASIGGGDSGGSESSGGGGDSGGGGARGGGRDSGTASGGVRASLSRVPARSGPGTGSACLGSLPTLRLRIIGRKGLDTHGTSSEPGGTGSGCRAWEGAFS